MHSFHSHRPHISYPDTLAEVLVRFLKILFGILGSFSSLCFDIANILPGSLYMLHKINGGLNLGFVRYVVCRKCQNIFKFKQCGSAIHKCPYIAFPNHPQSRMRLPCDTLLLKSVGLASGKIIQYPFMTYCYMGLEISLYNLLQRKDIYSLSEQWRNRVVLKDELRDVYDGKIWKDFINYEGVPFLSQPLSFGLMINVDWFQPYKYVQYSVGVIYISLLNLPRHERNKPNNIILIGIIPGPHEPSCDMNSYITPLVDELNLLWHGKEMTVYGFSSKQIVRCALLSAACDLPAGRKLCGFLSFWGVLDVGRNFLGVLGTRIFLGLTETVGNLELQNSTEILQQKLNLAELKLRSR